MGTTVWCWPILHVAHDLELDDAEGAYKGTVLIGVYIYTFRHGSKLSKRTNSIALQFTQRHGTAYF